MFNTKTAVRKIIGSTKRGSKNDWDGDGVVNKKDCQPRNTMRQDNIDVGKIIEIQSGACRCPKCKKVIPCEDLSGIGCPNCGYQPYK